MQAPIFPEGQITLFLRRRVCARCYGDLMSKPAPDYAPDNHVYLAYCPECGDAWGGTTVSKVYAEKLGQRAIAEQWEVEANLPDIFPSPHKGKTPEQLIKELGF